MEKSLIKFTDGIEIEIDNLPEERKKAYGKKLETSAYLDKQYHTHRKKIDLNISFKDIIKEKLSSITEAFTDSWIDINKNKLKASNASVEFGLTFNGETNFAIAKASAETFISIKIDWDFDKMEEEKG